MRAKQRTRGLALLLVLLITFVLTILTGAFVGVNTTNLNQLTLSMNRSNAEEACLSGCQYAWQRLDQDSGWATPAYFTTNPAQEVWPAGQGAAARLTVLGAGTTVTGTIQGTDMQFTMQVFNNLNSDTADGANRVPARGVRLSVDGQSMGATRHLDVVLRKKAFVDSSAVSQLDMTIHNTGPMKWNLDSTDPLLNLVRSNANINGPTVGVANNSPSEIDFQKSIYAPPAATGPFGSAWASKDIVVDGTVSLGASTAYRQTAGTKSKGTFLPKTGGQYKIPDLKPTDLNSAAVARTVPGGTYYFTISGANIPPVPGVAAVPAVAAAPAVPATAAVGVPGAPGYVPANPGSPAVAATPGVAGVAPVPGFTQFTQDLIYVDPNGNKKTLASVISGTGPPNDFTPVPLTKDVWVPLALDPNTGQQTDNAVCANLKNCEVVVAPGIKAVVPSGDFTVMGQLGSGNLALGTKVSGAPADAQGDSNGNSYSGNGNGNGNNSPKPKPVTITGESTLEVTNGNLNIFGAATGWGSVVADKGSVNLRLKNSVSTVPDLGVAIYAGKDVTMSPAWQSYGVNCAGASFQGLVYANGNFLVSPPALGQPQQSLSIEGALVSKGTIDIENANAVNFKYNPAYLYDIIKPKVGGPTNLEQVSFSMH